MSAVATEAPAAVVSVVLAKEAIVEGRGIRSSTDDEMISTNETYKQRQRTEFSYGLFRSQDGTPFRNICTVDTGNLRGGLPEDSTDNISSQSPFDEPR